jgi:hypothetical protein
MRVIDRLIDVALPSQELMRRERAYIRRTGQSPTNQQEKRWKKDIKQGRASS